MSIIVDALERVQTDRQDSKTPYHITAVPNEDPFANDEYSELNQSKTYIKIIIVSLVLVILANVYYMYQKNNHNENPFSSDFKDSTFASEMETINEVDLSSSIGQISLDESEKVDSEFLTAFKDDKATPLTEDFEITEKPLDTQIPTSLTIIAPTLRRFNEPTLESISNTALTSKITPNLTSLKPLITSSKTVTINKLSNTPKTISPESHAINTNTKPRPETFVQKSNDLLLLPEQKLSTIELVKSSAPEPEPEPEPIKPSKRTIVSSTKTIANTTPFKANTNIIDSKKTALLNSPDWLLSGSKIFHSQGLKPAIETWNKGFSSLKPKTPVISIMINRVPEHATDALIKLHQNKIDAFSVKGLFKGKPAFFTLALSDKNNSPNIIDKIEQVVGGKPYKSSQRYIQKRIDKMYNQNIPPVNTAKNVIPKKKNTQKLAKVAKVKSRQPIKLKKFSPENRLRLGQEAVINGDYDNAILRLRPVLFNNDKNWEVLFWMGSAKLGLGLYNEADNYFKNALAINAEIPQLWTQRAIISQEKDDHISALRFLQKAKTLAPNIPEVILNIAYSNDALGDRNGAVLAYREFLSLTRGNGAFTQQRLAVNNRLEELGF